MREHHSTLILRHLRRHGSIDPLQALELFNCFRLAARIHDLRGQGHDIRTIQSGRSLAVYKLRRD